MIRGMAMAWITLLWLGTAAMGQDSASEAGGSVQRAERHALATRPSDPSDEGNRGDREARLKVPSAGVAASEITVLFTNLAGDPTAQVPGSPGIEFGPGTAFDRPFGSPGGNWILSADTTFPTTEDEIVLVNGVVAAREGTPAAWTGDTENVGTIDTKLGINDAGSFVFATETDGASSADEYIVLWNGVAFSAAAQEGQAAGPIGGGATWGGILDSPVLSSGGSVGFSSDQLGGVAASENEVLVLGATLLAREGVTVPAGQIGSEGWEIFDVDDFWISVDGTEWMAQGDLEGDASTDDVVVVNGTVVVQEGVVLAGSGFAEPVDVNGIVGVHMDPAGNWFVRGNNDVTEEDWVYRNGAVIATLGDPIFAGATEVWTDIEFAAGFFFHVGNSHGHYVLGGVSDGPTAANGTLVLDGTHEVVREGDPVDLDGNGAFDDDVFFNTFGNDDGVLTDAGLFYFVATLRNGAGTPIGQGFFVADLSAIAGPSESDVVVTVVESADPIVAGSGAGNLIYTVTVESLGPMAATGLELEVTLTMPSGVALDLVTPSLGSYAAPTWTVGDLALDDSATLTFTLTVSSASTPAIDVIGASAAVTAADQTLVETDDDEASELTSISGSATVSAIKTVDGAFGVGGTVFYTITLTNTGDLDTLDRAGNELVDVLPPTLQLVDAMLVAGSGTVVAQTLTNTVTWDGGIPAGTSVSIVIEAVVLPAAAGTIIANQGLISYDSDASGDNDAAVLTDDPAVGGAADPTELVVALAIAVPSLGAVGLVGMVLLLGGIAVWSIRRSAGP